MGTGLHHAPSSRAVATNPKPEIRNPKEIRIPKPETREAGPHDFAFIGSDRGNCDMAKSLMATLWVKRGFEIASRNSDFGL
jgi:hypothetical protein